MKRFKTALIALLPIFLITQALAYSASFDIDAIINGVLNTRNNATKLSPSHYAHPGYEDLAFVYDKAVDALVLKAAGRQKEAEEVLDYFADRLDIPLEEIQGRLDTNGVYGILKPMNKKYPQLGSVKALVNAVSISNTRRQGRGELEFWTTPGPMSFLIFAFLQINPERYSSHALQLGELLLTFQKDDGSITDGDRSPDRVHTEPHLDSYDAFLMLYQVTNDAKWKKAADSAYDWFKKNVFHPQDGTINQGLWGIYQTVIFAEDVYSWTMCGPAGDKISLAALKKLTDTMLSQSLVKITLSVPDSADRTVILTDFTNPKDPRVKASRKGFHPMGSVEWTGGAILALQKNAVRFYNADDLTTAAFYKCLSEYLMAQTMDCFYPIKSVKAQMTFYATGQGLEVAPFGSIRSGLSSGWKTPFFYAKLNSGKILIQGGSSVGLWPLLPYLGLNPFILNDNYKLIYDKIPYSDSDKIKAQDYINNIVKNRSHIESIPQKLPEPATQIIEPVTFNRQMWIALDCGNSSMSTKNPGPVTKNAQAQRCYKEAIRWAKMTLSNPLWVDYAKRDNRLKLYEFGAIIAYPWGASYPHNEHPIHAAIMRYPLLNEVALAMWGLAVSYHQLGDDTQSKYWIERIIDDVALHQIAVTEEAPQYTGKTTIIGYWNALISWEDNPSGNAIDEQMGDLYREVLREKNITSAKPSIIELPESYYKEYFKERTSK